MQLHKMRDQVEEAAAFMQACAHPSRLLLLYQLAREEMNVSKLEQQLGICQPSLSQQLGVLRRKGLVSGRRSGQQIYYQLADSRVLARVESLYQIFCEEKRVTGENNHG